MYKITLTICLVLLTAIAIAQNLTDLTPAELKGVDLTGHYAGTRYQYAPDHKSIVQSFIYEFNLQQSGELISGTSGIIKDDGQYADMKLRGMVVGDKLYFEEYEIVNQEKNPTLVWCYKSGALSIKKDGDQLKLTGATDSYMADYGLPCSGGTTDLTKADNSNNFKKEAAIPVASIAAGANDLAVSPNPFAGTTVIDYSLAANASVTLEVFNITGQRVAILENGLTKNAGSYSVNFFAIDAGVPAGVLIAKLTVNGQVYSSEMVQVK